MTEDRLSKGFFPVEAYLNEQGRLVIMGEPGENDARHNCDEMGCGTLDHVAWRGHIDIKPHQTQEAKRRFKALFKRRA